MVFPVVRAYRNGQYYPTFSALPDSRYEQFISQLVVMLVLDLATSVALFYLMRRLYNINMVAVGSEVLIDRGFVVAVLLLSVHVCNDPYFSLFRCDVFRT